MAADSPLARRIKDMIRLEGPIGVDRFMALCLSDPTHGYYTTRDPFGAGGDFVTAPEISQMFGELVGLWAVETWSLMGRPSPLALVELGPGRGTLMADAWRAAGVLPAFRAAARIHLVETSPVLVARQRETLARPAADASPAWHESIDSLPDGPAIVIANEFFDALPVRQIVARDGVWRERLVGLDDAGDLAFGLSHEPLPGLRDAAPDGAIREIATAAWDIAARLGARLARHGGACLAIDYGFAGTGSGDTLQALRGHRFADPLAHPGEQDLTTHVDFGALARAAASAGAAIHGPVTQGAFLTALGLPQRAAGLKRRATPNQAAAIDAAAARLTAPGATGMGDLFKVVALADPRLPLLPGLGRVTAPDSSDLTLPGGQPS